MSPCAAEAAAIYDRPSRAVEVCVGCLFLDATIVISHSDKQHAAPTWKKSFGVHPMTAFAHDHGGGGEPLTLLLRPGNARSNTAADHIETTRLALAQLPKHLRRNVLIRTDFGGGTLELLNWLTRPGRWLKYSIGFTITGDIAAAILKLPDTAWSPGYNADRQPRPGAWVAELTGLLDLSGWPRGMRVIVRKERPHPGAQLSFTDGHRFTCFVTGTPGRQLADLELRHRRRSRAEDRIRAAQDTGLPICPCTTSPRTRSGLRTSPSPANCSHGCRCSPCTAPKPAATSPNACGSACSPSSAAWCTEAAACVSASPRDALGRSDPYCPGTPARPAGTNQTSTNPSHDQETLRARGTPPTRRDSRADAGHSTQFNPQPNRSADYTLITKDRG